MVKSSSKPLSLESVSAHFADWRHHRPHRRASVPASLWCEVAALLDHYPTADIARELKLKPQQIRDKASITVTAPQFIGISLPEASCSVTISLIEFVHSNGLTVKLHDVGDRQFDHLITRFLANC